MQQFTPTGSGHDRSQCQAVLPENNDCLCYYGCPPAPTTACNGLHGDALLNLNNHNIHTAFFNCYAPSQDLLSVPRWNVNGVATYADNEAQCSFLCSEEHHAATPCAPSNIQDTAFLNNAPMSHSLSPFHHAARAPTQDSNSRPTTSSHIGDRAQMCSAYNSVE